MKKFLRLFSRTKPVQIEDIKPGASKQTLEAARLQIVEALNWPYESERITCSKCGEEKFALNGLIPSGARLDVSRHDVAHTKRVHVCGRCFAEILNEFPMLSLDRQFLYRWGTSVFTR